MDDFDKHATGYSQTMDSLLQRIGQEHDFFISSKSRVLLELVARHIDSPTKARLLDVGCGIGLIEKKLCGKVGSMCGLDVSRASLQVAIKNAPSAHFYHYDGKIIPFENNSFDVTFAACVMHHIAPAERSAVISEMLRVTRPSGIILIIEHNPYNPFTRLMVRLCEFDRDAILLSRRATRDLLIGSGMQIIAQRYFMFIPFKLPGDYPVERMLGWIPFGAQYYIAAEKRIIAS
jgi:ubiquinone/menaquinone biosynthesis C-methylase UbiE